MLPTLKSSWNSVFMAVIETDTKLEHGTSFLVERIPKGIYDELYFVTDNHVIVNGCPEKGPCPLLKLQQSAHLLYDGSGAVTGNRGASANQLNYTGIEVVRRSTNPDLALLRVVVPRSPQTPHALKLPKDCTLGRDLKVYSIGFSQTRLRTDPGAKAIAGKNETFKRWSEGVTTGPVKVSVKGQSYALHGTTVDVIPGGSGGPMLNDKGEVIGVFKATTSIAKNNYAYKGNETPGPLAPASLMTDCETLKKFLNLEEPKVCD